MEYKNIDFKLVATGNARVGYCSKCKGKGWYDKDKIHQMKSKGCNANLLPEGEFRASWCR